MVDQKSLECGLQLNIMDPRIIVLDVHQAKKTEQVFISISQS